jgi:DNA-binding beta-propeller fold protein YncE
MTPKGRIVAIRRRSAVSRSRASLAAIALSALACLQLAVFASSSQAAVEATRTYAPGAFFGSQGSDPGQFNGPRQIAAEPGTGNLLVTDSGNGRVQVFATDAGDNPTFLTTLGAGTLVTPVGIAIDQGTGAIYVSDSGAGEVFRFTSDAAATPTYTLDPGFTSPALSSYASTLAVDPATHDLLVADTGAQEVRRFDVADGSLLDAFDGADSPGGQFTSLRSVAVAPTGRIFVADDLSPESVYYPGSGRVEQFDAAGNPLGPLQGIGTPSTVAVDPSNGAAVVGANNLFYETPRQLAFFDGLDSPEAVLGFPESTNGGIVAIAVSGLVPFGLYALTETQLAQSGAPGIQPFRAAEIPAAEIGGGSDLEATTAHVTGSVAPGTLSGTGTARFEYSLDGVVWAQTPDQGGITGPGDVAVSADLTGLRPNSTYSLRLHISNDDFSADSPVVMFATSPVSPALQISPTSERTATSATLNAKVNPFGQQTAYHFEYGESVAYGKTAPAGAEDVAGNGYAYRIASHAITGLRPATTYHYRLVAHNASGPSSTADATFTTPPASDSSRAYEQVTPVDKGGMVPSASGFFQARADGSAIVYQAKNGFDSPDTQGVTKSPRYAALRRSDGWALRQLDLPSDQIGATIISSTLAVSPDLSHALVASPRKLTPDAIEGAGNLYRRDIATGALELVTSGMELFELTGLSGSYQHFYGGSRDFSTVLLVTSKQLTPDGIPGIDSLYEWKPGEGLTLASTNTDGLPSDGFIAAAPASWPAREYTSTDATRIYFAPGFSSSPGLYLREEGGASELVSPPTNIDLLDTTSDGLIAIYAEAGDMYRYDSETNSRQFIATGPFGQSAGFGYMGMSDDGSSIFYATGSNGPLYVWHDGSIEEIATNDFSGLSSLTAKGLAASPNGRYFVFSSFALAGQSYDNHSAKCESSAGNEGFTELRCFEIYLYDVAEEELTCASCPADGSPSTGPARMGPVGPEFGHYGAPFVNDDGEVFFDTPTKLVPADTNGNRDVYMYRGGDVQLISPGKANFEARLADVSADGDDVFFLTEEGLVGQDLDHQSDLYDARVGGGIPSQSPAAAGGCAGADCRPPVAPPLAGLAPASETTSGAQQASAPKKKRARHKKHHRPKGSKGRRHRAAAKHDQNSGR